MRQKATKSITISDLLETIYHVFKSQDDLITNDYEYNTPIITLFRKCGVLKVNKPGKLLSVSKPKKSFALKNNLI